MNMDINFSKPLHSALHTVRRPPSHQIVKLILSHQTAGNTTHDHDLTILVVSQEANIVIQQKKQRRNYQEERRRGRKGMTTDLGFESLKEERKWESERERGRENVYMKKVLGFEGEVREERKRERYGESVKKLGIWNLNKMNGGKPMILGNTQ